MFFHEARDIVLDILRMPHYCTGAEATPYVALADSFLSFFSVCLILVLSVWQDF